MARARDHSQLPDVEDQDNRQHTMEIEKLRLIEDEADSAEDERENETEVTPTNSYMHQTPVFTGYEGSLQQQVTLGGPFPEATQPDHHVYTATGFPVQTPFDEFGWAHGSQAQLQPATYFADGYISQPAQLLSRALSDDMQGMQSLELLSQPPSESLEAALYDQWSNVTNPDMSPKWGSRQPMQ
ncbi:hypothetical protein IAT40_000743 [Kwoniella sp. CBS 6097]